MTSLLTNIFLRVILFLDFRGFLRDTPRERFGLPHGQAFSLISASLAVLFFIIYSRKKKTD